MQVNINTTIQAGMYQFLLVSRQKIVVDFLAHKLLRMRHFHGQVELQRVLMSNKYGKHDISLQQTCALVGGSKVSHKQT